MNNAEEGFVHLNDIREVLLSAPYKRARTNVLTLRTIQLNWPPAAAFAVVSHSLHCPLRFETVGFPSCSFGNVMVESYSFQICSAR